MELLDYVNDDNKTSKTLCHTCNMSSDYAYMDMFFLKTLYRKTEGRQILHWVISHDNEVPVELTDKVAQEVLKLLAEKYQVYAATHTNTSNCHTHFLINPIDIKSGKKFSESTKEMLNFRNLINVILKENGLNEIGALHEISKEEWDTTSDEECVLETKITDNDSIYDNDPEYYWVNEYENDFIWSGRGMIEGSKFLYPGILQQSSYESTRENDCNAVMERSLIRGVTYDNTEEMEVIQRIDGKCFVGKAKIENNTLLVSGILHEMNN